MGKHYKVKKCKDDCTTPYCCKKDCCFTKECCEDPREVCCRLKNAVVAVESQFILLGSDAQNPAQLTELAPNERADVVLSGNGFLIEGCRMKRTTTKRCKRDCTDVVCPKGEACEIVNNLLIVPASLVLLPPSISSSVSVYPDNQSSITGRIKNEMIPATRIFVGVFDVNGKGCSYTYRAELVGVDGSGNVALLSICHRDEWNRCLPCILPCHPRIKWGDNCKSNCGDKVYLLGDFITSSRNKNEHNSYTSLTTGTIADTNYLEHTGWVTAPSILVDAEAYGNPGMPILNCRGYLIGMQTTSVAGVVPQRPDLAAGDALFGRQSVGDGMVSGPTSRYIKKIVKAFLRGPCNGKGPCERVEQVCTSIGQSFYRYRKAYLGIAYNVVDPAYGSYTVDFTSGVYSAGERKIKICPNGDLSTGPYHSSIEGVRVVGLAGANPNAASGVKNGYYYVPGSPNDNVPTAPLPEERIQKSPLLGVVTPGDIIVSLIRRGTGCNEKSYILGDGENQYSPAGLLLRLYPEENVEVVYKKGGSLDNSINPNVSDGNYDCEKCHRFCLSEMPPIMDYPWYSINDFPRVLYPGDNLPPLSVYPQFVAPAGQSTLPQLPQLADPLTGRFHPAV